MKTILIIHLILSLVLPINVHRTRSKSEYIFGVMIAFLFPLGGYCISLLLNYGKTEVAEIEEDEVDIKVIMDMYKKENIDIISIEDSLIFSDVTAKRKSIIDVLKRDIDTYINQLRSGLKDEDTETAHYAASAIAEFTRKLDLKLQEAAFLYEQNKEDKDIGNEYFQIIKKYIESGILDGSTLTAYVYTGIGLVEEMLINGHREHEYYDFIINRYIELKDFQSASDYVNEYFQFEECENAYKLQLEMLYAMKDFEKFKLVFNQLLRSDLQFSREMLTMVRFWKGVARDESLKI